MRVPSLCRSSQTQRFQDSCEAIGEVICFEPEQLFGRASPKRNRSGATIAVFTIASLTSLSSYCSRMAVAASETQ